MDLATSDRPSLPFEPPAEIGGRVLNTTTTAPPTTVPPPPTQPGQPGPQPTLPQPTRPGPVPSLPVTPTSQPGQVPESTFRA
jgi:hypothetical protein